MASKLYNKSTNLLALIVDIPPHLMSLEGGCSHYLNSIAAFANLHLSASDSKKLCIVAATHNATRFLYPDASVSNKNVRQTDGRLENLLTLDENFEKNVKEMFSEKNINPKYTSKESLLSGAMARALLFIRRHTGSSRVTDGSTRILVIKVAAEESMGHYLNYINVYLTAQKIGVPIDVCCIGKDCGLLQQGADITGGYYHKVTQIESLLQQMVLLFDTGSSMLARPPPDTVDYRAACFCHRAVVNMAHVCSNCLSVYCKAVPLCSTCNEFFPVDMPKKIQKKKR